MAIHKLNKAFILGAGLGTRMRPLTNDIPKPMVMLAGRSIIWRILDKLRAVGVNEVVVNTHYLADVMHAHLQTYEAQYSDIQIHTSYEAELLDTGGGVKAAIDYFEDTPFYVIAGDSLWEDGDVPALERLAEAWDSKKMDILTLFKAVDEMDSSIGVGDYDLGDDGRAKRSLKKAGSYMWTNIRINTPSLYADASAGRFSFLDLMDGCERNGRLYALAHDARWHHISTPAEHEQVDVRYQYLSEHADDED